MKNYQDIFDALLRQNIDHQTRDQYLAEIDADPELKKEFDSYQEVFKIANILERKTIKEDIRRIYKDDIVNDNPSNLWKKVVGMILGLLALLAILYMINSKSEPANPSQIAETYFTAYPDKVTSMGQNEINLSAYNRQNYTKALIELEGSTGYEANFYRAICHIALKEYAMAEQGLIDIKNDTPLSYAQAYEWYLALAKIGNNKSEEALPILNSFANNPNSNYQKNTARALLKKLK